MTIQEAIGKIKIILKNCEFTRADKKSLKITISALEKQIPKVITFEKLICENFNGKHYYSIQYIENGERHIGYSSYSLDVISDYLKEYFKCGQAIDWSDD